MAETSYASCGDLSLAYQVFGNGPVVELYWTLPEFDAFMKQLSTFWILRWMARLVPATDRR